MRKTLYNAYTQLCVGTHAGLYFHQVLLTGNKGTITFQSVQVRKRDNTGTLAGNIDRQSGMHSRTQRCITNGKNLGPFRPVRPAGLDFHARPAGRPARCHI